MPKPDGGFYGVNDLKVGMQIDLYSRVLQVTDADGFTRAFMEKIGNPMGEKLPTPEDPYTKTREEMKQEIVRNQKYFHPRMHDDDLIRAPCPAARRPAPPPADTLHRARACSVARAALQEVRGPRHARRGTHRARAHQADRRLKQVRQTFSAQKSRPRWCVSSMAYT